MKNYHKILVTTISGLFLFLPSTAWAQTMDQVYGTGCVGVYNEFQFTCDCTFIGWQIGGNYTIDYDGGTIIDVHWNSPGNNWIKAQYNSGFGPTSTQPLTMPNSLTSSVVLSETSSPPTVCSNSSISFKATPTNGGSSPYYNWYVNGVNKANNSTGTFTWATWSNNDVVTVQLNSSLDCVTSAGSSNPITILVTVPPVTTLHIANPGAICAANAQSSVLYADATDNNSAPTAGSTPTYTWYVNSSQLSSDNYTSDQFGSTLRPTISLQSGQRVQCRVVSSATCASPSQILTDPITIQTTAQINPVVFINPTIDLPASICDGTSVTFNATNGSGYSLTNFNWTLDGVSISGNSSNEFTTSSFHQGSNISVIASVASGTCLTSTTASGNTQGMQLTVNPKITPSVSIVSTSTNICSGTGVTFTATPQGGGTNPTYLWKLNNNTQLPGNTNTFVTSSLQNGDAIYVSITSNAACLTTPTSQPANSSPITVNPVVNTTLHIADPGAICAANAQSSVLYADATDNNSAPTAGSTPTYTWYVNSSQLSSDNYTSDQFGSTLRPTISLQSGQQVQCRVVSSATCASPSQILTDPITIQTTAQINPVVFINPTIDLPASICDGTSVTFNATNGSGYSLTNFNWTLDGTPISGNSSNEFTTSSFHEGSNISIIASVASGTCLTSTTASGNTQGMQLTVNPMPVVTISPSGRLITPNTSQLISSTLVSGNNPTYQWYKDGSIISGASGSSYLATQDGSYSLIVIQGTCVSTQANPLVWSYIPNNYNYIRESVTQVSGKTNASDLTGLPVEQMKVHTSYYDGIGRPMQSVATQNSPSKLDAIQPIVYDAYGREAKKYLPVAIGNNGDYKPNEQILEQIPDQYGNTLTGNYIGVVSGFYATSGSKVASDTRPYSETIFESSPLDRPIQRFGQGQNWKDNNKSVTHQYLINQVNEVLLFNYDPATGLVSTGSNSQQGYYNPGQLHATVTTDEHSNDVIEYVDKLGHTVCKKVQYNTDGSGNKLYTSTYYIYDDLNNLAVVLPPEAVNSALSSLTKN